MFEKNNGAVAAQISSNNYDLKLKQIADQLIIKQGFILKKSSLKNGYDILIKETDTNFIIANIISTYDFPNPPLSIMISTYSKKRFF